MQGFLLQVDISEIAVHEGDEPDSLVDFLDSEPLASRRLLCQRRCGNGIRASSRACHSGKLIQTISSDRWHSRVFP